MGMSLAALLLSVSAAGEGEEEQRKALPCGDGMGDEALNRGSLEARRSEGDGCSCDSSAAASPVSLLGHAGTQWWVARTRLRVSAVPKPPPQPAPLPCPWQRADGGDGEADRQPDGAGAERAAPRLRGRDPQVRSWTPGSAVGRGMLFASRGHQPPLCPYGHP